jgi:hypothetical protein
MTKEWNVDLSMLVATNNIIVKNFSSNTDNNSWMQWR